IPYSVVSWLIVGWRIRSVSVNRRTAGQESMGKSCEYKQISSKSFHGELSFVKNSLSSLLRELKPVNFHLAFPMGLSCQQIPAFSAAVQRLSTTRKLQLTAVRSRGVAVGVEKLWL